MYHFRKRARFPGIVLILLFLLTVSAAVIMFKGLHLFDGTRQSIQVPVPEESTIPMKDSNQLSLAAMESIPGSETSPANPQEIISVLSPIPLPDSSPTALVVLDPGHGGIDPGAVSMYKEDFYEKDIVLDICLKLKRLLEESEIPVLMTRETDTEVYKLIPYNSDEDVRARPALANENNAALFVSVHVNSFDTKIKNGDKYNGTEVYYYEKAYGEFTGMQFAEIMGNAIIKKADINYRGIKQYDFGVLRLSNSPALLIETAFLTNNEDHKRLESDDFRLKMAQGIHDGIVEILETMGTLKK